MTIRLTILGLSLLCCVALSPLADAQRAGGGSGSLGGASGSGLGGGRLSGGGFGSGGVSGSRGMGSQGGGMGAMGGMGGMGGGMGQGMGGMGGMGGGMGMGMGGAGGGQMGFGSTGNQGFIGRDAADVQAMFQSMGMGAGQGAGGQGANRGGNRGGQSNRGQENQGGEEQTRSPIRVRVQVAFDYPAPSEVGGPVAFAPTIYDRILVDRKVENFAITRAGARIVITGVAADASERLLMERLVALEPGVTQIENQMTLAEEIDAPTLPDSEE
jgi:hypothetical protein